MNQTLRSYIIALLVIGLMIATYTAENKIVKVSCAITLIVGLIASLIYTLHSDELAPEQKRGIWIVLAPMASLIYYVYYLLK